VSNKLPAIKPKQLIRALERGGWQLDRVRGSHYIMAHPDRDQMVPVPYHNRDIKAGTLSGILSSHRHQPRRAAEAVVGRSGPKKAPQALRRAFFAS
jgi:predicted RNA binding protein YcfA (HicA-like mRNA interferase family)